MNVMCNGMGYAWVTRMRGREKAHASWLSMFKLFTAAPRMAIPHKILSSHINPNEKKLYQKEIHRRSYMSAHVLLNLSNEFGKSDKMRGLSSILLLFRNEFNKFNNVRFYSSHDI